MAQVRHPIRRALGVIGTFLVLFFLAVVGVSLYESWPGRASLRLAARKVVALVSLEGEISDADSLVETIDELGERASVAAVVVRINSPGGAVAPSQELHDALKRLRRKKPVVASLGSVAASGGYYVACAADEIVANPGTLTGSIGVILTLTNVGGLMEKLGVQANVVKAGALKDMGSPFREMSDEERQLFQRTVDVVHTQFIEAVADGRKLDPARARSLADGRVFTGAQAKEEGLVDSLGGLHEAIRIAAARAGLEGEPRTQDVSPRKGPWWWRALAEESLPFDAARAGVKLFMRLPVLTPGYRW